MKTLILTLLLGLSSIIVRAETKNLSYYNAQLQKFIKEAELLISDAQLRNEKGLGYLEMALELHAELADFVDTLNAAWLEPQHYVGRGVYLNDFELDELNSNTRIFLARINKVSKLLGKPAQPNSAGKLAVQKKWFHLTTTVATGLAYFMGNTWLLAPQRDVEIISLVPASILIYKEGRIPIADRQTEILINIGHFQGAYLATDLLLYNSYSSGRLNFSIKLFATGGLVFNSDGKNRLVLRKALYGITIRKSLLKQFGIGFSFLAQHYINRAGLTPGFENQAWLLPRLEASLNW